MAVIQLFVSWKMSERRGDQLRTMMLTQVDKGSERARWWRVKDGSMESILCSLRRLGWSGQVSKSVGRSAWSRM